MKLRQQQERLDQLAELVDASLKFTRVLKRKVGRRRSPASQPVL
jgi:hypothetical protein